MSRGVVLWVLAFFTLIGALTGCGAPDAGTIREKDHRDAYYTTVQDCISRDTKTGTCRTTMPRQQYHPERWSIEICDGEDCGWVSVSEGKWDELEVGDFYTRKA